MAVEKWGTEQLVLINVICAAIAGSISSAIANPTDVVKVRMQVNGNQGNLSLYGCFHEVYRHEGVRGLWRVKAYALLFNYAYKGLLIPIILSIYLLTNILASNIPL